MNRRIVVAGIALLLSLRAPLAAQGHRGWLALGPGTLNPDDPFRTTTLSLRGSAGWILGDRDAISAEYTRQSANGSEGGVQTTRDLKHAAYVDAGVSIRYPLSNRFAAVGTLEDALAFLPKQVVTSGSTVYEFGGSVQNNFGLFVMLQWRP